MARGLEAGTHCHMCVWGGAGALRPAGQRWSWGVQGTSESSSESSGVEAEMQWAGNK